MNSMPKPMCPLCWHGLRSSENAACCEECGAEFPIDDSILYCIAPDRSWLPIVQDTVSLLVYFPLNRDRARELAGIDTQNTLDEYAKGFEGARDQRFFQVWDQLPIPAGALMLEVGAGDMRITAQLRRRGYQIVAIEPVPEFLNSKPYDGVQEITKVCCSASRIPYASGTFDVVYCQAMLHHVESIGEVIHEMARVLRPGGVLLIATEPVSAKFRNMGRVRDSIVDVAFDIGINENQPQFHEYYQPLRESGVGEIRAFATDEDIAIPRKMRFVPGVGRLFKGDRWTCGWGMLLRHTFSHGQVSLVGIRDSNPLPTPSPMTEEEALFDRQVFVFGRNRSSLVDIWKRLLPLEKVPRSISVGRDDRLNLRCGFSRKVQGAGERPYKWLQAMGAFFMQMRPSDGTLAVEMQYPEDDASVESQGSADREAVRSQRYLTMFQDEGRCECIGEQRAGDGWRVVRWKLQPAEQTCVTEICMKAERIGKQDEQPVCVKLRRIWIE